MQKHIPQKSTFLRFRRWSRAGYAVFCSLGCCVTIGCLAVSISEKSLQKEAGTPSSSFCREGITLEQSDLVAEQPAEFSLLQLQEVILLEQKVEGAAACGSESYLYYV